MKKPQTILEALANTSLNVRVTCDDKWLTLEGVEGQGQSFVVRQKQRRRRTVRELIVTHDEQEAVSWLING